MVHLVGSPITSCLPHAALSLCNQGSGSSFLHFGRNVGDIHQLKRSQLVIGPLCSKGSNRGNLGLMDMVAMLRWDMSSLCFGVGPIQVDCLM